MISRLNSFRTQLLVLIIGLLSLVLIAVFIAVNQANERNARLHLEETLQITAASFQQTLAVRNRILLDKARLLSGDFAFKKAVATQDQQTILSVLENHRLRVKASVMMLATLEGQLIADTLHPQQQKITWLLQRLQQRAENSQQGEASGIQHIDGIPYQLVLTPLFSPQPSAWIVIGFRITDRLSQRQAEQTHSEVSLLYKPDSSTDNDPSNRNPATQWQLLSSTLNSKQQQDLSQQLQSQWQLPVDSVNKNNSAVEVTLKETRQIDDIELQGKAYLSLILPIESDGDGKTMAVLQRSLEQALAPYLRLRTVMLLLFGLGLIFSMLSAIVIARSLSRPLEALTQTVKKISEGDYQQTKRLKRNDELGILSLAINQMSQGLQERDQVRNLLGKVVSPEIASELLSKKIELGGEERQATILFSDIRQFTQLCEHRNPKEILQLLNRYLSAMSDVIEQHNGVIDKYIGDAIMALFDVPVAKQEAPEQAVKAALNMIQALSILNTALLKENESPIRIGIGINSGEVVAGNMGSANRLNYTVIGDGVNLASRLEGLTKYFGVSIIVSESTAQQCPSLPFRELGRVQVKGKQDAISIFEPLASTILSSVEQWYLSQYKQALQHFRQQNWQQASSKFKHLKTMVLELDKSEDKRLYDLYLDNIKENQQKTLPKNWQGTLVFSKK